MFYVRKSSILRADTKYFRVMPYDMSQKQSRPFGTWAAQMSVRCGYMPNRPPNRIYDGFEKENRNRTVILSVRFLTAPDQISF